MTGRLDTGEPSRSNADRQRLGLALRDQRGPAGSVPGRPELVRLVLAGLAAVVGLSCHCEAPSGLLSRHAWAAAAGRDDREQQVAALVRSLNDERLSVRNEAEQALIQLGPQILSLLPQAAARMSAEAEHRVARVRQTLERARAEATMQPTRVRLPEAATELPDLLAAIERQTGNKLYLRDTADSNTPHRQLKVAPGEMPFWPALDSLLDQAGLTTYHFSPNGQLLLVGVEEGQLPRYGRACYAGPLRFEAIRADAHRQLRTPTNRALNITVEIAWEPRLAPIGLIQSLRDIRAFDPHGQPILPANPDYELTPNVPDGTTAVQLQIPFALPPRDVQKIARLEGELQALVPGGIETFRFELISGQDPIEKRKGNVVVTLEKVRKNRDVWEVRMRARYEGASGALDSHRGWVFKNECSLVGADGTRIEHSGFTTTRQTETEVGLAYLFDLPQGPEGFTFEYRTPVSILRMPVKFLLQDILLP